MNIISIFIFLSAFVEINTTNVAKIQKIHLEIDDHLNSETEKLIGNNFDGKKTKPNSKLAFEAKDPLRPQCPDWEIIYPCSCFFRTIYEFDYQVKGVFLDCSRVTSELELQTIFGKSFPQNDMYKLFMNQTDINNSSIKELPLWVFGSKTFRFVHLQHISFNFSFNSFAHMNATLHKFYVYSAPIYKVNHNFNAYAVLYDIWFSNCPLTDFLISSPTLEVLSLSHTNITERAERNSYSFGPMPNLREFHMTYGNLYMMPDTSGYPKLQRFGIHNHHISSIDVSLRTENYFNSFGISNNDLQDIPVDSIRMAENSSIYMNNNQIRYLEEGKWRNIFMNASRVSLIDNPLDCSCVIAWLFGKDNRGTPFIDKMRPASGEKCDNGVRLTDLDPRDYEMC